jgi:hypothetical protein
MSDTRYCIICDKHVDITDMTIIFKSHGGRGRTIVIDPTTEVSHIVLSKKVSARRAKETKC